MIKKLFTLFTLSALLCAATGCSSSDDEPVKQRQPVVLKGEIFALDSDVATVWSGGQAVGVYMVKKGTNEVIDGYANKKHFADNRGVTGYLVPADNVPMYLPDDGTEVDYRVYYPYDPEVKTDADVSTRSYLESAYCEVIVDKNTAPDGFLYSRNSNYSTAQKESVIQLKSMLSVVNLQVECPADTKSLTATIKGTATKGLFDLMEGQFVKREVEVEKELPMKGTKESTSESTTFTMEAVILSGLVEMQSFLEILSVNTQNEVTTYDPLPLAQIIEVDKTDNVAEENTQYNVSAQITEGSNQITTKLLDKSSIVILKWVEDEEDPIGGVARPEK